MIKYVLLTLGLPAKGAVLQKRRHLVFPVPGRWQLHVPRLAWGWAGARSPSPCPCPIWYLALCCGQRLLCPGQGGVGGRCLLLNGFRTTLLGLTDPPRGVPHPRGWFHSYGRGWGAMEVLGQLYTCGYLCEDALNAKQLSQGVFVRVVGTSLVLLMLSG